MTERQEQIVQNVQRHRETILEAERWLWAHPQTGYTEWEAHDYLKGKFEGLGYSLALAGNIPGFYTDLDTGRPGPKLCIMGELDALDIAGHPESVNGMTHCCGHHAQGAALLGIAAALKEPGALEGMSGSIRLMAVPAEEMIQLGFREELRQKGVIRYLGGKVEFLARGFFDGVDLSLMVHGTNEKDVDFTCGLGCNGCIAKTIRSKGRSAVNIIPDEMKIESYVRGRTLEAIRRENKKINRALAGAALAIGAGVELHDRPGYSPEYHDPAFMKLVEQCCKDLVGEGKVRFRYDGWSTGSSDFGDITCVMPGVQFNAAGATGTGHGIDYQTADPDRQCVGSAKAQLLVADALLKEDAAAAKGIVAGYEPKYPSAAAFLAALDAMVLDKDAVVYDGQGNATVDYQNAE